MFPITHSATIPICVLAAMTVLSGGSSAFAAPADDLAAIREAITNLRQDYEAKIKDLEDRLQKAQAEAEAAKASADSAQAAAQEAQKSAVALAAAPEPQAPRTPTSNNAFNPGIAAVLNGFFVAASHDPSASRIPGFALGDAAQGPSRGFSLGESEVNLTANIDPYFLGWLNLSFGNDNSVGVEEAYIQTTSLGEGITLRAGRMFSGIAYLNERHAHDWSFSDASLPYRAFLNGQYGDDGVQARWLAPTSIFLELGAEWFRGDSFPAGGAADHGAGTVTAFAHAGDDINDSSSWLAGLSYLHARSDKRDTGGDLFSGTNDIGIASLVYKWAPGGNPVVQNLILSGEYFFGHENGLFNGIGVDYDHSGWYVQGVYQFMPRWSFGLRYAELEAGRVGVALMGTALDDLGRTPRAETALLEFDTSEFGRLRLQYTHDDSDVRPLDQVLFQYTVIYGPHPAHRY
ncbi:MAG TPA: hypothetical protein VK479_07700 [Micropepsaceae bacterium]|nr:hypothetical protein [Micropepsaceae bacterium]